MTKLPTSLRQYFWDVDFNELKVIKHHFIIIKRVLDRGDTKEIRWLVQTYGFTKIKEVILVTKDLSRKTGIFWASLLDLNLKHLPCLQKPYSPIQWGLYS